MRTLLFTRTILLTLLALCSMTMFADDIKRPTSYNFIRGNEAMKNSDYEEALEYFKKEIAEHPDNGYAHLLIAAIKNGSEDFGEALTAANAAIKHLPSKDKAFKAFTHTTRAEVYLNLEDTVHALKDYAAAIHLDPGNEDWYNSRAQIYFEQGKYDLADQDYRKMIALKEGSVMGYMGIGRNATAQGRHEDAIKQFDYVIKLAPTYSSGYSFRAHNYIALKKYNEAIDDYITALGIDHDDSVFAILLALAESVPDLTIAKLKAQKAKEPNESSWIFCLGSAHEAAGNHKQAIAAFKELLVKEQIPAATYCLSKCYSSLGQYDKALEYCNQAIDLDPTQSRTNMC